MCGVSKEVKWTQHKGEISNWKIQGKLLKDLELYKLFF